MRDDDELPALPPLDGEDNEPESDLGDVTFDETGASLDDALSDDLAFDEIDVAGDLDARPGDDEPIDVEDPVDDLVAEVWTSDLDDTSPANADDDLTSELGDTTDLAPDDRGAEGVDDGDEVPLEALPPLDDDADGDDTLGDEVTALPESPAFSLPRSPGFNARVLTELGHVMGIAVVRDGVMCVGADITLVARDDTSESIDAPDDDDVPVSLAEDAHGAQWLGTLAGTLWRRIRDRDAWRKVATFGDERSVGALDVVVDEHSVWVHTGVGSLHRSEDGARFEAVLVREAVHSVLHDAHGGVLVALRGRRRDALRSTTGDAWATLALPEAMSVEGMARSGDVIALIAGVTRAVWVSDDGGTRWTAWPLFAGATAVALTESDDGEARLVASVFDDATEHTTLVVAHVSEGASPANARQLVALDEALGAADEEGTATVTRIVTLDRAATRMALLTDRGTAVLVSAT
jgi:hypothetical protein